MKLCLHSVTRDLPQDYWTRAEWEALAPSAGDFCLAVFRAVDGFDVVTIRVLVPASLDPEAMLAEAHAKAAARAQQVAAATRKWPPPQKPA